MTTAATGSEAGSLSSSDSVSLSMRLSIAELVGVAPGRIDGGRHR